MKLKSLLPVAAAAMASMFCADALAVPAYPGLVTMTNPDGSTVDVRIHGDEFFSYYTDAENEVILSLDTKGYWKQRELDGRKLTISNGGVDLLKSKYTSKILQPVNNVVVDGSQSAGKRALSVNLQDGRSGFPHCHDKNMKGLVVLLEYSNKSFSIPEPQKAFERLCNQQGYSEYGHNGSVKDYFTANSHGQFIPTFDVVGPYKVSRNYEWYTGDNPDDKYERWGYALEEALKLADADGVDFSQYDLDDDGFIDFIYFIYAGFGQADSSDKKSIWPHRGDFSNFYYFLGLKPLVLDGKTFNTYACSNELIGTLPPGLSQPCVGGIGTICHEFSHVLGLPDTYDTNGGRTKVPGDFDIMCGGNYLNDSRTPVMYNAYERYFCRWMELTNVEEGKDYTFNSPDSEAEFSALKVPLYRPGTTAEINEFFVIESRRKSGWDAYLPEEGVMVWRVKFSSQEWVSNNVNINNNPRFELLNSSSSSQAWPGKAKVTYVTPESDYPIAPTFSTDTEIWLTDIEFNKDKGTGHVAYNVVKEFPELTTVLKPANKWKDEYVFQLDWDAVPEATGYLVNLYNVDSDGSSRLIESVPVKENHYYSEPILAFSWKRLTYRATVTVIKTLPSILTSNEIEFKLSELPEIEKPVGVDKVEDAGDNILIAGGAGCVIAPDGAEVYSLSGVKVGHDNLPAGIYIVRYGSKAVKVAVK